MTSEPQFRDKFVAFVDILGFCSRVEAAEKDEGLHLSDLLEHCSKLAQTSHTRAISDYGPTICPESRYERRSLDYVVTQISDCVVISAEVSPAGIINLLHHVSASIFGLFTKGIMVRGYVTRGNIFHNEEQIVGTGYQHALKGEQSVQAFRTPEDEGATPFVEIDPAVVQYIKHETDACVSMIFSRLVKEDPDNGVTALFPFQHLIRMAGGNITDPDNCKKSLDMIRESVHGYRARMESQAPSPEPRAIQKLKHYGRILNYLMAECDKLEGFLVHSKRPAIKVRYDENFNLVRSD